MDKELINFSKLLFALKLFPNKYSKVKSYVELDEMLNNSPKEEEAITKEMSKYSEEELMALAEEQLAQDNTDISYAKKGASLKKLSKIKKPTMQKCACGCNMKAYKEKGGKIMLKCACGCKNK